MKHHQKHHMNKHLENHSKRNALQHQMLSVKSREVVQSMCPNVSQRYDI